MVSGLEMRSRYRCLWRSSTSLNPCHFSGGGRRALERMVKSSTWIVISPVLVLNRIPSTPMMSPRSRSPNASNLLFPTWSCFIYSCTFPVQSFIFRKDWTGKVQLYIKQDQVGKSKFEAFGLLELGDIIGVEGILFKTRTGEITIQVEDFTILSKALLPPPEKWHGLRDVELRHRQRYLDLISNPETMKTSLDRVKLIRGVRRFLDERGYVEVETPMMQPIPGGAVARPFITHHNTLDIDLYLRIAPELYHKRLRGGGREGFYKKTRTSRNGGIPPRHN